MGDRSVADTTCGEAAEASSDPIGKTPVAGIKDRETNQVQAKVVAIPDGPTIKGFVHENTEPTATVYTDEAGVTSGSGGRMRRSGTAWGSTCGNRPARTAWRVSGPV